MVSGLNRNTANRYLGLLRERMAAWCEAQRPFLGVVEADESYFGARRVKGQRGRGAGGKTIVFDVYERLGQVYCEIVPDASRASLQKVIRRQVGA